MNNIFTGDIADMEAIYPWQGYEVAIVLAGVAIWLIWHIVQVRQENSEYAEDIKRLGDKESILKSLDDHPH